MHDGVMAYEPSKSPKWLNLGNVDAWTTTFDLASPKTGYAFRGFDASDISLEQTTSSGTRDISSYSSTSMPPNYK